VLQDRYAELAAVMFPVSGPTPKWIDNESVREAFAGRRRRKLPFGRFDTRKGETVRDFYAALPRPVVVGIEATGSMGWFLQLLEELAISCHVGHPARIRAAEPRRQKHDRRDAHLLLDLLRHDRFPSIWMPSAELRDLRALLLHRDQWVRLRTRVRNALHGIALAHGMRRGAKLRSRAGQAMLAELPLQPHAGDRRSQLQGLLAEISAHIDDLNERVRAEAQKRPQAVRLMTHPGIGPVTALATEVFVGDPTRFRDGKALASYVGDPERVLKWPTPAIGPAHEAG
jgi:transposase